MASSSLEVKAEVEDEGSFDSPSSKHRRTDDGTSSRPLPMNLWRLAGLVNTDDKAIKVAQAHGLLPHYAWCPTCHKRLEPYQKVTRKGKPPYYRFQCTQVNCRKSQGEVGLKKGTWFEGSKLSFQKSFVLLYCFAADFSHQHAIAESSLFDRTSSETVVDYYNYCREVCAEALFSGADVKEIGGPNCTVEVDVAAFGKPKLKHNRGRIVEEQWALGGICRERREYFFVPVEDMTQSTLVGVIKQHVRVGTIIHTDCLPSYNSLQEEGYQHMTMDNSQNVDDSNSGACTNLIKFRSTWWAIRQGLRSNTNRKNLLALHLAEYIWRQQNRGVDVFLSLLRDISTLYPGVGGWWGLLYSLENTSNVLPNE